jgi:hypothetical protein
MCSFTPLLNGFPPWSVKRDQVRHLAKSESIAPAESFERL